ncbi:MAG: hypothetical protein FJW30_07495 [Acidobacteria bacterium]|nr:hypothetical protein [Acidobacteriota bacterium]
MQDLVMGDRTFRSDVYPTRKEEFAKLEHGPAKRTPFVCRNAGNIVPAHDGSVGGVPATFEPAVRLEKAVKMTNAARRLSYWEQARTASFEICQDLEKVRETANPSVFAQPDTLRTHSAVAARVAPKRLGIQGNGHGESWSAEFGRLVPVATKFNPDMMEG